MSTRFYDGLEIETYLAPPVVTPEEIEAASKYVPPENVARVFAAAEADKLFRVRVFEPYKGEAFDNVVARAYLHIKGNIPDRPRDGWKHIRTDLFAFDVQVGPQEAQRLGELIGRYRIGTFLQENL